MRITPDRIEEAAKELYLRALRDLPPDIKRGFEVLAARETGTTAKTVLARAIAQCAAWHGEGLPINVSINLSARDLIDDTLPDRVAGAGRCQTGGHFGGAAAGRAPGLGEGRARGRPLLLSLQWVTTRSAGRAEALRELRPAVGDDAVCPRSGRAAA